MPETTNEMMSVCSFGAVQKLYEAAKYLLEQDDCDLELRLSKLVRAVMDIEEAANVSEKLEHIREIARNEYIDSNCDIDIDTNGFTHHNGEPKEQGGGYWVGAWLWVGEELDGVDPPAQ